MAFVGARRASIFWVPLILLGSSRSGVPSESSLQSMLLPFSIPQSVKLPALSIPASLLYSPSLRCSTLSAGFRSLLFFSFSPYLFFIVGMKVSVAPVCPRFNRWLRFDLYNCEPIHVVAARFVMPVHLPKLYILFSAASTVCSSPSTYSRLRAFHSCDVFGGSSNLV